MPELPEMEGVRAFLHRRIIGARIAAISVGAISAVKTADPALPSLTGHEVTGVGRRGKFLLITLDSGSGTGHTLAIHLSRAGWMAWRANPSTAPLRMGRSRVAVRLTFVSAEGEMVGGLDLTEAGTQKRLALFAVARADDVPGIARMGPEVLSLSRSDLDRVLEQAGGHHLKTVLRDQTRMAGVGNAWSDDILHTARLSPAAAARTLDPDRRAALHEAIRTTLSEAVATAVAADDLAVLKDAKRTGLRIHGHFGDPCPTCGEPIRQVSSGDSSFQYCATCQTGGRPLADRRLSRLLK